jgi:hypothetical protein
MHASLLIDLDEEESSSFSRPVDWLDECEWRTAMEFQSLYAKVEANQGRSSSQVIALLRQARTSRVADSTQSEVATKWGVHALEVHRAALGDEIWSVYEQVLLAALGQNDQALADQCADALDARFDGSARVRRLLAMRDEASGEYADAEEVYGSMLEDNPANALAFKRRVAILRAQASDDTLRECDV